MAERQLEEFIIVVKHPSHVETLAEELEGWGVSVEEVYKNVFYGFRARLGTLIARWIKNDPRIESIEMVEDTHLFTVQEIPTQPGVGAWHLDRIDQISLPLTGNYTYLVNGTGVTAYIIDSGAQFDHVEYNGRVSSVDKISTPGMAFDPFIDIRLIQNPEDSASLNATRGFDENGHGSHVAGIIGAETWGVAKNVTIKTAKVFGSSGLSSTSIIISGIDAILEHYNNTGQLPSVANMSLGGNAPSSGSTTGTLTPTFISGETIFIDGVEVPLVGATVSDAVMSINNANIESITATATLTALTITKSPGLMTLGEGNGTALATLGLSEGVPVETMTALEKAVAAMVDAGITVFAASGNQGKDANLISPARMPQIMTVGATDRNDSVASFSNFGDSEDTILPPTSDPELLDFDVAVASNIGSAVEIYAPGVGLISTWLNTVSNNNNTEIRNRINVLSGTSMASPMVAGVGALILSNAPFLTPDQVKQKLIDDSTTGILTDLPSGSFNRLVYSTFGDYQVLWLTPAGDIGSYDEGQYISFGFNATIVSNSTMTYSLEAGILPVGVTLNSVTGMLTGIPDFVNTDTLYNFTIRAQAGSLFDDRDFELTVVDADLPVSWVTPSALGGVNEGDTFSIQVSAISQNGVPSNSITYSASGTLPHGWTVSAAGLIEGLAPIVLNTDYLQSFTLIADDGLVQTDKDFNILIKHYVNQNPPMQPYWQTPSGVVSSAISGDLFSYTLVATDEDGFPLDLTYHLELSTGDGTTFGPFGELPPGLSLNETTGEISGIIGLVPNDETFEFGVWITDGANVSSRLFGIDVLSSTANVIPEWLTPSGDIGTGMGGQTISYQVLGNDPDAGPDPLSYFLVFGDLPPGQSLDTATGEISGTIDDIDSSTRYVFTIRLGDGASFVDRTFAIPVAKVNTAPEWLTPAGTLGSFDEGSFITQQLLASDPHNDILTYSVLLGSLPPGIFLNSFTGEISGTLIEVSADTLYVFTLRVDDNESNAVGEGLFANREFSITVIDGALNPNIAPVWITGSNSLSDAVESMPYSDFVVAVDPDSGPAALQYILASGALPLGLSLNSMTGEISGSPIADGNNISESFNFVIAAYDGIAATQRSFSIQVIDENVSLPPVWISTGQIASYAEGDSVNVALLAEDPEAGLVIYGIVSGTFPPGLILNSFTGVITGIAPPVVINTSFVFTARATDVFGNFADEVLSIEVLNVPNVAPVWTTPAGSLGIYPELDFASIQLEAVDPDTGPLALTYSVIAGTLPPGLILDMFTGEIAGIPDNVLSSTLFNFTVSVTDGADAIPRAFSIEIEDTPVFAGEASTLYAPLSGDIRKAIDEWNNDQLIPDDILYQPGITFFGRVDVPTVYVAGSIHTSDKDTIQNLFGVHHRPFSDLIGIPTFAVVRDNVGEVIYEVIYLPIVDQQLGSYFNITGTPSNLPEYVSYNFDHLRVELLDNINPSLGNASPPETGDVGLGYENSEILPLWMTAEQVYNDSNSALGYIPAIELAYVLPDTAEGLLIDLNRTVPPSNEILVSETTFDRNELSGEQLDPIVNAGDSIIINNQVIVTFTGGDVFSARDDIKQALADANIVNIGVSAATETIFTPNVGPGPTLTVDTGRVLRFNFEATFITLNNVVGAPLTDLGFSSGLHIETVFDSGTTTFDKSLTQSSASTGNTGLGLRFAGIELTFDRYAALTTIQREFQLKWFSDLATPYWLNDTEEAGYTVIPYFITQGGSLGIAEFAIPVSIQVEAKSSIQTETISYSIIFGSLPLGLSLDTNTGEITGEPTNNNESTSIFIIRAQDTKNNYYDRRFTITVIQPATTFDVDETTFDTDETTFDDIP